MKTKYSIADVQKFLLTSEIYADVSTVKQLNEGHTSQVFRFADDDGRLSVFRIRQSLKDLIADEYASTKFSGYVPVPEFKRAGEFYDKTYFAITEYVDGDTMDESNSDNLSKALPSVYQTVGKIYTVDISGASGYGDVDFYTGNAVGSSYKAFLKSELDTLTPQRLIQCAAKTGLRDGLVDDLIDQFSNNLPYVSEVRRLLHGDPGGNNFIVKDNEVVAVLDWEQMSYGDWVRDYSRFLYWSSDRYVEPRKFGEEFGLELENLDERIDAYLAMHTLRNIEFAARFGNEKVARWLLVNAESKLS